MTGSELWWLERRPGRDGRLATVILPNGTLAVTGDWDTSVALIRAAYGAT